MCPIPYEVSKFFGGPNSSSHVTTLESTQPLTEMNIRIFPEVKEDWCIRPTTSAIFEPIVYKM
jgi:hypothetical protein